MGDMRKLVYLFELDSVRNADDQMELAMTALFREIVMNGNAVAITFNQLIDSRFFLSLLNDARWSDCIMKLFQSGAIRISQFGKFRTPSQYLINQALDSKEEYIFSGLPIRSDQKALIALAKRSLMYSDMTELNEYIFGQRTKEERRRLFREQVKCADAEGPAAIRESSLDDAEMMNTLRDLQAVLNLILQFSNLQNAYNPPKDFNAAKEGLTLHDYLLRVKSFTIPTIPEWETAIGMLERILAEVDNQNKRSEIVKRIYGSFLRSDQTEATFRIHALSQAIVDLCYNYACEASIGNVSRHYDISELQNAEAPCETFEADFLSRLQQSYGDAKWRKAHFLTGESNDFKPYQFKRRWFCNLNRAVHLSEHASLYAKSAAPGELLFPYEYHLHRQQLHQRGRILWGVGKKLCLTVLYLLLAFIIENYVYGFLGDLVEHGFETTLSRDGHGVLIAIVATFISAAAVEWISGGVSRLISRPGKDYTRQDTMNRKAVHIELPTFGECLENVVSLLGDFVCAIIAVGAPYANRESAAKLHPTQRDATNQINYVSKSVSEYLKFIQNVSRNTGRAWMFDASERMPMLDVQEDGEDIRLTQIEELTGRTFGIAYCSPYHMMIVDPVRKIPGTGTDNDVYPYERLAQVSGQPGIVAVPILRKLGKPHFVLIKQYRHAIRREQFCFPRGFGESGLTVFRNAQKELWEEIGAVLRNPATSAEIHYQADPDKSDDPAPALTELGRITTDSGSMCDHVVVMQAELARCNVRLDHEGIINLIEIDEEELRRMILSHEIDDGFTIGAFSLWSMRERLHE